MAAYVIPRSLEEAAQETRMYGGLVVRARVEGLDPEVAYWMPSAPNEYVATPTRTATLVITDALGESVGATLRVRGRSGVDTVIDRSGCATGTIVSENGGILQDQLWIPEAGEFVFWIARPPDGQWRLVWRARIDGAMVSGVNTVANRDIALDALRR